MQHSDDAFGAILVDRQARVLLPDHQFERLVEGGTGVVGDDLVAGPP